MSTLDSAAGPIARLPQLSTRDLNGVRRTLPNGRLNVLLIAYQRWQQLEADTWVPVLDELERGHDSVSYFELPVVGKMSAARQRSLDHFMRSGIPRREMRARTLTFHVDAIDFREPLGLPDEDHIAVVLVDIDGFVLWRGFGPRSASAERSLRAAVTEALQRRIH